MAVVELRPNLTVHRGGRDPVEMELLLDRAADAMRALADALPHSDHLRNPADAMAEALDMRRSRMRFRAEWDARRRGMPDAFDAS